ncbi:MAG TPA: sn-glycerol-3-phosphate ABC transporter ATP-binding protein UgpC [Mycobacteriales bacterium]|nr:sn-glycerol-3-phosphate ABC transporter ATP-binding protein UgpC [Mycobacteriales bacterium]
MATMVLSHVGKVYEDGTRAVTDLNLEIEDGELVVFVGPSGCGKTTALRMVAGLETVTEGQILIGDRVVNDVPPRDRDVAMVFQSYALYPHMTVRDNIGFGLKLRKMAKPELDKRVEHAAEMLGLTDHLDRKPRNLSGGQRQRVAMGRAIVRQPHAFLMDEPLSNLDAKLRVQMRAEIGKLQRDLAVTTIYVTHDQTEAMTLGHRVAVMRSGVLQQVAPPQVLYDRPKNLFVAGFIGSPAMNFLSGALRQEDSGQWSVELGTHRLQLPESVLSARPALKAMRDKPLVVGIRPEDIEDAATAGPQAGQTFPAVAELVEPLGADIIVYLSIDAPPLADAEGLADLTSELESSPLIAAGSRSTVIARFNPRSHVDVGDNVVVVINTERLHFFDAETGEAIWDL